MGQGHGDKDIDRHEARRFNSSGGIHNMVIGGCALFELPYFDCSGPCLRCHNVAPLLKGEFKSHRETPEPGLKWWVLFARLWMCAKETSAICL